MYYLLLVIGALTLVLSGCGGTSVPADAAANVMVASETGLAVPDEVPAPGLKSGNLSVNIYGGERPIGTHYFTRRLISPAGSCSGTQLTPYVVLTAKHCVTTTTGQIVPWVNVSGDYQPAAIAASRIILWPDGFDTSVLAGSGAFYKKDLALIVLASPVAAFLAVEYRVGLAYALDDRPVVNNELLQIAGYGLTQFGPAGTLNYGDVYGLAQYTTYTGVTAFGTVSGSGRPHVCGGDSGGPTYRVEGVPITGSIRLVGVHSTGSDHDCKEALGGGADIAIAAYRNQILALAACGFQTPCLGFDVFAGPSNLKADLMSPPSGAYLTWNPSPSAVSVTVEKRILPGGAYQTAIADYTLSYGNHVFVRADFGLQYAFRVTFKNGDGRSSYSSEVTLDTRVPTPPTNLAVTQPTIITAELTWSDSTGGLAAFQIERRIGAGAFAIVETLPATSRLYRPPLGLETAYTFRVRSKLGGFLSAPVEISFDTRTPTPPTNFHATPWNESRLEVGWTDASSNETGFVVERLGTDGRWVAIQTVPANTTRSDTAPYTPGGFVTLRVRAKRFDFISSASNDVTIDTRAAGRIEGFTGTKLSATSFKLTWTNVPYNTYDCNLEVRIDGYAWSPSGMIGDYRSKLLVLQNALYANHDYQFRTRCYNFSGGYGPYSDIAIVSTK